MAQIWEPPHIAEPNAESNLSQEVLYFTVPSCSGWRLRHRLLALISVSVATFSWQGLLLHLRQQEKIRKTLLPSYVMQSNSDVRVVALTMQCKV